MTREPSRLLNRHFFLLWQGQTISQLGGQVFNVAMLLWIKHATGSATTMGLMLMLSALPAVILGPLAGTFVDRRSRRGIVIASNVLRGIASLSLAGLMFSGAAATRTILAGLFAVSLASAVVGTFFNPAVSAAIPELVPREKVAAANSLAQSSFQLSTFLGQGIGGTLFRMLGAPALFLLNGLGYLFAAASACFITIPQSIPPSAASWRESFAAFKRDLLRGFGYVWANAGLRTLVLVSAALNFFTVPVVVLLPFYVEDFLKVKADWYGFIMAAYGVGSLAGYVSAGALRLSGKAGGRLNLITLTFAQSVGFVLLGMLRDPYAALVLAALGGFGSGIVIVSITTILQLTTPGEMRGRVFGLLGTIAGGLVPMAMGLSGVVADLLDRNIPSIYVICGTCTAALAMAASLSRPFRDYLRLEGKGELPAVEKQAVPLP
jgi:MFS family permease